MSINGLFEKVKVAFKKEWYGVPLILLRNVTLRWNSIHFFLSKMEQHWWSNQSAFDVSAAIVGIYLRGRRNPTIAHMAVFDKDNAN